MEKTQPDLSVIIVSYNAWEFLDLTLNSVRKAIEGLHCEVIVVDNASETDIVNKVQTSYPFVNTIANNENVGFSKANNMGLKRAKGRLALLLNPDVIVAEDTFHKVLNYYKSNPDIGGLGIRMLNGEGYFLKESKRGLPTPLTSFYKILGLCRWFPRSKTFAQYYHGNLDESQDHQVDVLSGAFLVQKRDSKDNFELLDENYFMYGEDIDLSYQLKQKFGSNHYLGTEPIIHFKGKTTPESALIYHHFYQAMWMFHVKYFKARTFAPLNLLIWITINGIQRFKIWKLSFKNLQRYRKRSKIKRVILFSSNKNLEQKLRSIYAEVELEMIKNARYKSDRTEELIVFDLSAISSKEVIQCLKQFGPGHYAYSSPCGHYIIENGFNKSKGQVYYYG